LSKFALLPRHEDVWRNGSTAPHMNLDIRWRSVLTFTFQPL